jgi:hypothetical protein
MCPVLRALFPGGRVRHQRLRECRQARCLRRRSCPGGS